MVHHFYKDGPPDVRKYQPLMPLDCNSRQRGKAFCKVTVTKWQLTDAKLGEWAGWVEELQQYIPEKELVPWTSE